MKREVWLTVTGEQKDPDGRSDRNAVRCRAFYETRDGEHRIVYRERDAESGGLTESEMLFAENFCRIDRTGAVTTSMRFTPGEDAGALYETGFGTIRMKIHTRRLAVRVVGENFHARVSYTLSLEGGEPLECAVTVKAEPV